MCMTASLQNRMADTLVHFESVINSRWFLRTSVILFLTRVDEFKAKLPKVYCGFRLSPPLSTIFNRFVRYPWKDTSQSTQVART
jgi:hypothetical protein